MDGVRRQEACLFLTEHDSPGKLYTELNLHGEDYAEEYDWFPDRFEPGELLNGLGEVGIDPNTGRDHEKEDSEAPDIYVEKEPDGETREYELLGKDGTGLLHFYRYTPEYVEVLHANPGDEGLDVENRDRVPAVDPEGKLEEYQYQQNWEELRDIEDCPFHNLPAPEYFPEQNSPVGGTLSLDDDSYSVPFRFDFDKATSLLEDQADDGDVFVDYRPQYIDLAPEDALQKYRLISFQKDQRGETEIVDQVQIRDRGTELKLDEVQVDELAETHFTELLSEVVDSSTADLLIEEYGNLRTVSWASTSDVAYLENTFGVKPHEFHKELNENGLLRNEHSPSGGRLHFPRRRADELSEPRQQVFFDDVLKPQEEEEEMSSEQSGFDDF